MKNILVLAVLSPFLYYGLKEVFLFLRNPGKSKCSSCPMGKSCAAGSKEKCCGLEEKIQT